MARVFVSHPSDGAAWDREVHQRLVGTGREVFLDPARQYEIAVGQQWGQRLHERLQVGWCVVTSGFREPRCRAAGVEIARKSVQHIDLTPDPGAALTELVTVSRSIIPAAVWAGWMIGPISGAGGIRPRSASAVLRCATEEFEFLVAPRTPVTAGIRQEVLHAWAEVEAVA